MPRRDANEIGRRRPAHLESIDDFENRSIIVFVTVCTQSRKRLLASDDVHNLLVDIAWPEADHWSVGRYVIMPDHLHLFCSPARTDVLDVKRWITYWKSAASNNWPRRSDLPVWCQGSWDRQLRAGESYDEKWQYVVHNPVRHGLVKNTDDWPYQGELNILEWHDL